MIGLPVIIITALLSSQLIEKQFSPLTLPTAKASETTHPTAKITSTWTLTPDICAPGNIVARVEKVNSHMIEFGDASQRTSYAPSEQLNGSIAELQRIRRDAENEEVPLCLTDLKTYQIQHMNLVIDTLVAFMGGTDAQTLGDNVDRARQEHDRYILEYDRLLELPVVTSTVTDTPSP